MNMVSPVSGRRLVDNILVLSRLPRDVCLPSGWKEKATCLKPRKLQACASLKLPEANNPGPSESSHRSQTFKLFAQIGDLADRGPSTLHEEIQPVQEELLLRMGEPTPLPSHLHIAHQVFLNPGIQTIKPIV